MISEKLHGEDVFIQGAICTDIYKKQAQQREWKRKSFSNLGFEKHYEDPKCLESDLYPQEFKNQCEKEVERKT